jgi:hypothetical protein
MVQTDPETDYEVGFRDGYNHAMAEARRVAEETVDRHVKVFTAELRTLKARIDRLRAIDDAAFGAAVNAIQDPGALLKLKDELARLRATDGATETERACRCV